MQLTDHLEFYGYLVGSFADADLLRLTDEQAAVAGLTERKRAAFAKVLEQGRDVLLSPTFDWKRIAQHANRDFEDEAETRAWLIRMMDLLEGALKKL